MGSIPSLDRIHAAVRRIHMSRDGIDPTAGRFLAAFSRSPATQGHRRSRERRAKATPSGRKRGRATPAKHAADRFPFARRYVIERDDLHPRNAHVKLSEAQQFRGHVEVIATEGAVKSKAYTHAIRALAPASASVMCTASRSASFDVLFVCGA